MSSNCLACTDPVNDCPACPAGQSCIQTGRSCSACPKRICQDNGSSGKSSGGGGSSTGATAGGAVGGVIGVAVILAAVYFFWWRPRGLAASRRKYSRHLSQRQSKLAEKRKSQQLAPGTTDTVTKRTSVHLHMDAAGGDAVNRRNTSPGGMAREGGALVTGRTSEDDNPFGDQNRSSIGDFDDTNSIHTSEFSFRSSHTNVIPIAYIPPHSSSMSIADAQRGAYGESGAERENGAPPSRSQAIRASIPTSMASRDSLALAGAEIIELNPLPPVLTPDTPAVPHGTLANGAPIRPPRSPGLDLKLPNTPKVSSPLAGTPVGSPDQQDANRRTSGFPFPPPTSGSSPTASFLSPANSSPGGRGMSVLGDPRSRSAQSHLSTITTRSATSTMSYILDPPQIITPVSGQGVRRVELQKGQAGLVKIGAQGSPATAAAAGGATPASPTSPSSSVNPFDDSNRASVDGAARRGHSRIDSQETVKEALLQSRPTSTATDTSRWTASSLASEGSVQFLQGQTVTFTNPNSPLPAPLSSNARLINTASGASFDVPQSARSSEAFDTGSQVRPLTGSMSAWATSSPGGTLSSSAMAPSTSRDSTASGMSDGSLLEGIPFMPPSSSAGGAGEGRNLGRGPSTSSVSLGLPVNVTAPIEGAASVRAPSIGGPEPDDEDDDPLPAPFLPFAGQRPTSSKPAAPSGGSSGSSERVQSAAISVRSGFGSGLSQIPFQLGFPSGFGEDGFTDIEEDERSERGSLLSRDSRVPASEMGGASARQSYASSMGGPEEDEEDEQVVVVQAARTTVAPAVPSAAAPAPPNTTSAPISTSPTTPSPSAPPAEDDSSNPFGAHAEVPSSSTSADPRASMDSLALAMGLAASLDAEAGSQA
ncbi:hypothetical protein JCM10450v2_004410 [Rhodotorula kratochvilovae]